MGEAMREGRGCWQGILPVGSAKPASSTSFHYLVFVKPYSLPNHLQSQVLINHTTTILS